MNKKPLILGFHTNISGGIDAGLRDAHNAGANAAQIFTKSNRQYLGALPDPEKIIAVGNAQKELDFYNVFVHAGYLINLAVEPEVFEKSYKSLELELALCAAYGFKSLVLHPGSAGLTDQTEACKTVGKVLKRIMNEGRKRLGERCPDILVENMAGQGSVIGHTFAQLATIAEAANDDKVKFCIDSAHLFASGWNLRDSKATKQLALELDQTIGWKQVKLIHLNDSKEACGAKKDRHESWPEGTIGFNGLENLLSIIPSGIPLVLETPVGNDYSKQIAEMTMVRNVVSKL